tara:strand:+ start:8202 stop:8792 length:591 start_codon:yes stop_codon:yes gene_type:complete
MLQEIQNKFNLKTDKNDPHTYFDTYDRLFAPFLDKDINVLEIGVLKGESLKLWSHYFSDDSEIFGIDIFERPGCSFEEVSENVKDYSNISMALINSFEGDESARNEYFEHLKLTNTKFHIIVDDGNHNVHGQTPTFRNFQPFLADGGIYIIEDIKIQSLGEFKKELPEFEIHDLSKHPDLNRSLIDNILAVYENRI